ncbi:MAG: peptidylprolyl isomerase, partial [Ponticaulis sp.]|nr:peptidylprolyl isomerase [Ponticaulis sp.]
AIAQEVPEFSELAADSANWREAAPENLIQFRIQDGRGAERGVVLVEMAPFSAPGHIERFQALVASGDLNGTVFHRVIDDFMSQGGDVEQISTEKAENWPEIPGEFVFTRHPLDADDTVPPMQKLGPNSSATDGYILGFPVQTQSEYLASLTKDASVESWIAHCPGVASTARTTDPNSATTQFFLMRGTADFLDRQYTAWGRVVHGQEIVETMKTGEPVRLPEVLISAKMVSDMPEADRPRVLVQKTDGPAFASVLQENAGANVCDLPAVPSVAMFPED